MIKPLRDNVLVELLDMKKSKIVRPDTAKKEMSDYKFIVKAIGNDVKTVKVGDEIIVPFNVGIPVIAVKEEWIIFHEDQILAIKEPDNILNWFIP